MAVALMLMAPVPGMAADGDSISTPNPILWADVPDPDVIRVGDTYYILTQM